MSTVGVLHAESPLRLRPRHVIAALLVGLLFGLLLAFRRAGYYFDHFPTNGKFELFAVFASRWTVLMAGTAVASLIAIATLDALERRGAATGSHYLAAAATVLLLCMFVLDPVAFTLLRWTHQVLQSPMRPFWLGMDWLGGLVRAWALSVPTLSAAFAIGAMSVAYHARARRTAERLAYAQWQLTSLAQRRLAEELHAAQASVDPALLSRTLGALDSCFIDDPVRARALLGALIRFLRAALPPTPEASSTLAQQAELAEAFVEMVALQDGRSIRWDLRLAADTAERLVAPLVLLPLVRDAVERRASALSAQAAFEGQHFVVKIIDDGDTHGPATDRVHAELDNRLRRLYGAGAGLQSERGEPSAGRRMQVRIPMSEAE